MQNNMKLVISLALFAISLTATIYFIFQIIGSNEKIEIAGTELEIAQQQYKEAIEEFIQPTTVQQHEEKQSLTWEEKQEAEEKLQAEHRQEVQEQIKRDELATKLYHEKLEAERLTK